MVEVQEVPKMPTLITDKQKPKPRIVHSFLRERIDAETARSKAAKIEYMIEAKVAQALRLLRC